MANKATRKTLLCRHCGMGRKNAQALADHEKVCHKRNQEAPVVVVQETIVDLQAADAGCPECGKDISARGMASHMAMHKRHAAKAEAEAKAEAKRQAAEAKRIEQEKPQHVVPSLLEVLEAEEARIKAITAQVQVQRSADYQEAQEVARLEKAILALEQQLPDLEALEGTEYAQTSDLQAVQANLAAAKAALAGLLQRPEVQRGRSVFEAERLKERIKDILAEANAINQDRVSKARADMTGGDVAPFYAWIKGEKRHVVRAKALTRYFRNHEGERSLTAIEDTLLRVYTMASNDGLTFPDRHWGAIQKYVEPALRDTMARHKVAFRLPEAVEVKLVRVVEETGDIVDGDTMTVEPQDSAAGRAWEKAIDLVKGAHLASWNQKGNTRSLVIGYLAEMGFYNPIGDGGLVKPVRKAKPKKDASVISTEQWDDDPTEQSEMGTHAAAFAVLEDAFMDRDDPDQEQPVTNRKRQKSRKSRRGK